MTNLFNGKGSCDVYNDIVETIHKFTKYPYVTFINEYYPLHEQYLDKDFSKKLKHNFYGTFWELRCAKWLKEHKNIEMLSRKKAGADFVVSHDNQQIYFEATSIKNRHCEELQNKKPQNITITPYIDAIRERIRSAIRAKGESNTDEENTSNYFCWRKKNLIGKKDPFIIAIDVTRLYELKNFSVVLSIPTALIGAVLPLGNFKTDIDRSTKKAISNYYCEYQSSFKKNKSSITTDLFLKKEFSHISAVLISWTRIDLENELYTNYMLIHNPLAQNPLPQRLFKANYEIIVDHKACILKDLKGNQIGLR